MWTRQKLRQLITIDKGHREKADGDANELRFNMGCLSMLDALLSRTKTNRQISIIK
jgi:hypothetical protein